MASPLQEFSIPEKLRLIAPVLEKSLQQTTNDTSIRKTVERVVRWTPGPGPPLTIDLDCLAFRLLGRLRRL